MDEIILVGGSTGTLKIKEMVEKYPEEMLERAIKGMLPNGRLGRQMGKKLFVYAGPEHEQTAQKPEKISIK